MSEQQTVMKKKKKQLPQIEEWTVDEAVNFLKNDAVDWENHTEQFANRCNDAYQKIKYGKWKATLKELKVPQSTWRGWTKQYKFPIRYPNKRPDSADVSSSDTSKEIPTTESESKDAKDSAESAYATEVYNDIYRILDEAGHLTKKRFDQAEKREELIEKLGKTAAKLNGLLVTLESNL